MGVNTRDAAGTLELHWSTDLRSRTEYQLYTILDNGQLRLESTFEQGPFETAVEVSQWVARAVARLVPPAMT